MQDHNLARYAWSCRSCGHDLVELAYKTRLAIKRALNPNMAGFKLCGPGRRYRACPRCNAYALGIDTTIPFPIQLRDGTETDTQRLFEAGIDFNY